MKLLDIKKAIIAKLKEDFTEINIYSPDEKEGFKKPSFFIELLPVTREHQNRGHYFRKVVVIITYFSKHETELENLKMQDNLEDGFGQTIEINDRVITIDNVEGQIIDKVLQFRFDIEYLDSIYVEEDAELMQELVLNFNKEV